MHHIVPFDGSIGYQKIHEPQWRRLSRREPRQEPGAALLCVERAGSAGPGGLEGWCGCGGHQGRRATPESELVSGGARRGHLDAPVRKWRPSPHPPAARCAVCCHLAAPRRDRPWCHTGATRRGRGRGGRHVRDQPRNRASAGWHGRLFPPGAGKPVAHAPTGGDPRPRTRRGVLLKGPALLVGRVPCALRAALSAAGLWGEGGGTERARVGADASPPVAAPGPDWAACARRSRCWPLCVR